MADVSECIEKLAATGKISRAIADEAHVSAFPPTADKCCGAANGR